MVLIFVALKAEANPIRARLSVREALADSNLNGDKGCIAGVPAALITTGMGMRRSRIASARAMDSVSGIDLVLISGVAGALRDDLTVGQVVLAQCLFACRGDGFEPEHIIEPPGPWLGRRAQRGRDPSRARPIRREPSRAGSVAPRCR